MFNIATITICILCTIITALYCIEIGGWIRIWRHTPENASKGSGCLDLSLVVAIHNEEKNIERLISSITQQSKPISEIIFVLDHCTDKSEAIIRQHQTSNTHIAHNTEMQGKKTAQRIGVNMATNNIICVVDGDCILQKGWHETLSEYFANEHPCLLIEPVIMKGNGGLLQTLFELDFLALQMATAGTALRGRATMCNGANLAFHKKEYTNHDAKTNYISGDDMFLLSEIKAKGHSVAYIKNRDAIVRTDCPQSLYEFFKQRTRWLRKSTGYTDKDLKQLAWLMFLGNVSWPTALMVTIFDSHAIWAFSMSFVAKFIVDYALLMEGGKFWTIKVRTWHVTILALVYPFTMIVICIGSLFRNKNKW